MPADERTPRAMLRELLSGWDQALRLGYGATAQRELEDRDDLFFALCFGESFGLPNPASWYTLELYPVLLEEFHDWHRRMGMARSPLDHIRCC